MTTNPLPYRPNVGIALFNAEGLVFAGRSSGAGPETVTEGPGWQMPQGGIDPDEDLIAAARRELMEETSISSAELLGQTDEWWPYDFPTYNGPWHHLCAYRGQTQRWVAFRFTGNERDINVTDPVGDVPPEFYDWAWMPLRSLPPLVMPHRRPTYERVAESFAAWAA